jgi:RHS repeat-associated protein
LVDPLSHRTTFVYDGAGRVLSETDPLGRLTTFAYSPAGTQILRVNARSQVMTATYDLDSRRVVDFYPTGRRSTFTYDANDNLLTCVKKETPTEALNFLYDAQRLLEETDDAGDLEGLYTATEEEYGDLVSEYDGVADHYPLYDAQRSADALIDGTESQSDQYKYRAFGLQVNADPGPTENPFQYVGKQGYYREPELDLYFLGMGSNGRPYDPATGQFITPDKIEDDSNPFRYVLNNPVNHVDPSGLQDSETSLKNAQASLQQAILDVVEEHKQAGARATALNSLASKFENHEDLSWSEMSTLVQLGIAKRHGRVLIGCNGVDDAYVGVPRPGGGIDTYHYRLQIPFWSGPATWKFLDVVHGAIPDIVIQKTQDEDRADRKQDAHNADIFMNVYSAIMLAPIVIAALPELLAVDEGVAIAEARSEELEGVLTQRYFFTPEIQQLILRHTILVSALAKAVFGGDQVREDQIRRSLKVIESIIEALGGPPLGKFNPF